MRAVRREARREPRASARPVRSVARARRGAFTMLELMVAIAIIVALVSLVVVGARAAQISPEVQRSAADQADRQRDRQYAVVLAALDGRHCGRGGKGWPDFIPAAGCSPRSPMAASTFRILPGGYQRRRVRTTMTTSITYDPQTGEMTFGEGDPEQANECLAFGLTSVSGKGPYIKDEMKGGLMKCTRRSSIRHRAGRRRRRGRVR